MEKIFLGITIGFMAGVISSILVGIKYFIRFRTSIADLNAQNNLLENTIAKENELFEKFSREFEASADRALKQNSNEFSKTNREEIYNLLRPFREKLVEFESKVEQARVQEAKEFSSLESHIRLLFENNQKICSEAKNLTEALKGSAKQRGNWGEFALKRIFEVSGLVEGVQYTMQESFRGENNGLLRPDAVVYLPENRHIVIDSKVSLISYEKYFNNNENSDEERNLHLREFLNSVKEHIKSLKNKYYQDIKSINAPDFVLMFIPIEGGFNLAFGENSELIDFAWKNRIILTSPSTLLTALKTIELFWRQEKQTQNVIEIAEESGRLYDKFVGLVNDLETIRSLFAKTADCFDSATRKIEGQGGLIYRVEKLRELGARNSKSLNGR